MADSGGGSDEAVAGLGSATHSPSSTGSSGAGSLSVGGGLLLLGDDPPSLLPASTSAFDVLVCELLPRLRDPAASQAFRSSTLANLTVAAQMSQGLHATPQAQAQTQAHGALGASAASAASAAVAAGSFASQPSPAQPQPQSPRGKQQQQQHQHVKDLLHFKAVLDALASVAVPGASGGPAAIMGARAAADAAALAEKQNEVEELEHRVAEMIGAASLAHKKHLATIAALEKSLAEASKKNAGGNSKDSKEKDKDKDRDKDKDKDKDKDSSTPRHHIVHPHDFDLHYRTTGGGGHSSHHHAHTHSHSAAALAAAMGANSSCSCCGGAGGAGGLGGAGPGAPPAHLLGAASLLSYPSEFEANLAMFLGNSGSDSGGAGSSAGDRHHSSGSGGGSSADDGWSPLAAAAAVVSASQALQDEEQEVWGWGGPTPGPASATMGMGTGTGHGGQDLPPRRVLPATIAQLLQPAPPQQLFPCPRLGVGLELGFKQIHSLIYMQTVSSMHLRMP